MRKPNLLSCSNIPTDEYQDNLNLNATTQLSVSLFTISFSEYFILDDTKHLLKSEAFTLRATFKKLAISTQTDDPKALKARMPLLMQQVYSSAELISSGFKHFYM